MEMIAKIVGIVVIAIAGLGPIAYVMTRQAKRQPGASPPEFDLEKFRARVRGLALDDPLWPQLRALLRANVRTETEALASPGLDDAEAHRLRGRVGMLLDFERELQDEWVIAHSAKGE